MEASQWLRRQTALSFSNILLLQHAVARGGFEAVAIRREIEAAIVKVRLDEDARALGFGAEQLRRVRLALFATADEFAQQPGSRCDYSDPPPAGEPPLLQQRHLKNTTSAGHHFFTELELTIKPSHLDEVGGAVLEVFALCLALGFCGKYRAHGLSGLEAMQTRVKDKLNLVLIVGPPMVPAEPWSRAWTPGRWSVWVTAVLVVFVGAMLVTYWRLLGATAAVLQERLVALQQLMLS
jgi:type IV/VI secretion system ImpK/VasF family protein